MPLRPVRPPLRPIVALFVAAGLVSAGLAACGTDAPPAAQQSSSGGAQSSSGGAQGGGGAAKPGGAGGGAGSGAQDGGTEAGVDPWRRTAVSFRGRNGERFKIGCPARGVPWQVWGTAVYTDDSSICNAAVHVGLITSDGGGDVIIEISEGLPEYRGSTRNGVESITYGATAGSFTFPEAEPIDIDTSIVWERDGSFYGTEVGARFTVVCREGGQPSSVWGTGIYTSDSSICTAAVHAGLLDVGERGEVTFEIAAGQASYQGSRANGITSLDYDKWESSFSFVA